MTNTRLTLSTLVLVSLSLSRTGAANTIAISAPPEEPIPKRVELNVATLLGGLDLGRDYADANGVQVSAGLRVGDLSVLGELDYFGVRADERGKLTRVGLTSRYSLVPIGNSDGFATSDVWVEGGLGWENLSWNSGGVLDRPDIALGIGWQANVVMDRKSEHPRYLGPYFALRTLVAQAPQSDDMATCGGPCDRATRPSATDVSFFFTMGLNWGRTSF